MDFDPGNGISNISSVGFDDAFIFKLDSAGNFIWAKSMGGTTYDYCRSLAIDNADNVYLIGDFEGVVDFDPGADTFNLTSAVGGTNVFISKLDSGGNFIWAKGMIGLAAATGSAIALDASGNVYSTGYFIGTIDLDPDTSTLDFTSFDSEEDVFISKLDSSGTFQWAKSFGGVSTEVSYSISLDDSANVLIAGGFRFSVDFDPGVGTYNLTPIGTFNGYVSKLDSAGNFIYALAAGGLNSDFIRSISIANTGETFIAGYFGSSVISFGSITLTNASSNSDRDFFIAKFDNLTTGFEQLDNNKGISLFPNPSNNYFNLIINNITELSIVSIIDINGKIVYSVESQSSTIRINTSDFATGIYICKVKSGTEISTKKLIKY